MKKIITATLTTLTVSNALAYVDPGTGVAVLGSLGPVILAALSAVAAFIIKIFWTPIKTTFLKLKKISPLKKK